MSDNRFRWLLYLIGAVTVVLLVFGLISTHIWMLVLSVVLYVLMFVLIWFRFPPSQNSNGSSGT